jgi:hypothetical protein
MIAKIDIKLLEVYDVKPPEALDCCGSFRSFLGGAGTASL